MNIIGYKYDNKNNEIIMLFANGEEKRYIEKQKPKEWTYEMIQYRLTKCTTIKDINELEKEINNKYYDNIMLFQMKNKTESHSDNWMER